MAPEPELLHDTLDTILDRVASLRSAIPPLPTKDQPK